jgi:peptide/nickel transport system permease protein
MTTLTAPGRVVRPPARPGAAAGAGSRVRTAARALGRYALDVVLVLWVAATLAFATLHLIPGDPVDNLLRGNFQITPEMRAQVTAEYGLDRPLAQQYASYLAGLLRGDLGTSFQQRAPVTTILASEAGYTAELAVTALVIAFALAVLAAVTTAGRPRWRWLAASGELVAVAVPSFWTGLLLLVAFSFTLRWFPSSGAGGPATLVLPALTLALPIAGQLGQLFREGIEAALDEPHATTARTRGASEARVRWRHALRHALLPGITVSGTLLAGMLVGTTIVETLFGRPGLGRIMLRAVTGKDIPVVMGVVVLAAVVFVVVRIVVDLLHRAVDPRLRAAEATA